MCVCVYIYIYILYKVILQCDVITVFIIIKVGG